HPGRVVWNAGTARGGRSTFQGSGFGTLERQIELVPCPASLRGGTRDTRHSLSVSPACFHGTAAPTGVTLLKHREKLPNRDSFRNPPPIASGVGFPSIENKGPSVFRGWGQSCSPACARWHWPWRWPAFRSPP